MFVLYNKEWNLLSTLAGDMLRIIWLWFLCIYVPLVTRWEQTKTFLWNYFLTRIKKTTIGIKLIILIYQKQESCDLFMSILSPWIWINTSSYIIDTFQNLRNLVWFILILTEYWKFVLNLHRICTLWNFWYMSKNVME